MKDNHSKMNEFLQSDSIFPKIQIGIMFAYLNISAAQIKEDMSMQHD